MTVIFETKDLLLSLQRSLLGCVRPDLRAVLLNHSGSRIAISFILDHKPSKDDIEFYSEALIDFYADFSISKDIQISELFFESDKPYYELNNKKEVFAYLRYEE